MRKVCLLLLLIGGSYADNTQYFNDAYQMGKQNQGTLNLNANSTYTSYANSKGLESNFYDNANAGTVGSQDMTSASYSDKNYLYNKGVQDLQNCQNKSDPRCSTMNKYSDKDTTNQYQAYSTGINEKYFIRTRPDPSDTMCTFVITKSPINETTQTCISAPHEHKPCNATIQITISNEARQCDPTKGECTQYSTNPNCTLTKNYVAPKCTAWNLNTQKHHNGGWFSICKTDTVNVSCTVGSTVAYQPCGTDYYFACDGKDTHGWNWSCTNYTPMEPAIYQCKFPHYSYNDGCKA